MEPKNIDDDRLLLTGDEAKHLAQAVRAKPGDVFYAIDGTGLKYRAVVSSIGRTGVNCIITNTTRLENEPFTQLTLAQGICRPSKMDEIVERGTEIGVSSFVFYFSEKTYSRAQESLSGRKLTRLHRIARAAAKQSKRSIIPAVGSLISLGDVISLRAQHDLSLLATANNLSKSVTNYLDVSRPPKKVLLLVGPESGLTDPEEAGCLAAGFLPTSLGPRRLRTETAGIIFPALILQLLGDL